MWWTQFGIVLLFALINAERFSPKFFQRHNIRHFGKASHGTKIVGGRKAYDGEFPYQVSIRNPKNHACGGSIIDQKIILTAAHCLYDPDTHVLKPPSSFVILAGTNQQKQPQATAQFRNVSNYFIHEKYNSDELAFDIAILVLSSPLNLNDKVTPVSLSDTEPKPGTRCRVSGWGYLSENSWEVPNDLYTVDLTSISREQCDQLIAEDGFPDTIQDDMICLLDNAKDACGGDSGGPMLCNNQLNGIVSFGDGCAHPQVPGVYASVAYFRNWISSKIGI